MLVKSEVELGDMLLSGRLSSPLQRAMLSDYGNCLDAELDKQKIGNGAQQSECDFGEMRHRCSKGQE